MLLNRAGPLRKRRPRNVDPADRVVRLAIGASLVAAATLLPSGWQWLALPGSALLLTGVAGWCPLYAWLAQD